MNAKKLKSAIRNARSLERNDNHLSKSERLEIVNAFRKLNPDSVLPENVDDAFVEIIF